MLAAVEAIFAATAIRAKGEASVLGNLSAVIGAPVVAVPDLDAFEERAAIREHDGGEAREDAERGAAAELGFEDPAALFSAAADHWRRALDALARRETSPCGRRHIAAALRFVAQGWAEQAAALGWTELELFGVAPKAPWAREDRMGAAYSPFKPIEVTAETFAYAGSGSRPMRRWRGLQAPGSVTPWT
ncbi:MAG: hypothetical protein AAF676_04360 [Pseudomonadota bacterium]